MLFKPFYVGTNESKANSEQPIIFNPKPEAPFEPFLIQDPFGLRKAIVPVFKRGTNGDIYGMGTAFHVDGWGTFLTADHVIDFARERSNPASTWASFSANSNGDHPVLFLGIGLAFGMVNVPEEAFAVVEQIITTMREKDDPLSSLQGRKEAENASDLAVMSAVLQPKSQEPGSIPVRASGWYPRVGETVFAIGFPELVCQQFDKQKLQEILREGMYGAYGCITKIYPKGRDRSNPTPVFEVDCHWEAGMSGGPVFNSSGEVVGLVSRSLLSCGNLPGAGWATCFALVPNFQELVPSIDLSNFGWRLGWGVLKNQPWDLAGFFKTKEKALQIAESMGADYQVKYGSNCFGTDDFVSMTQ